MLAHSSLLRDKATFVTNAKQQNELQSSFDKRTKHNKKQVTKPEAECCFQIRPQPKHAPGCVRARPLGAARPSSFSIAISVATLFCSVTTVRLAHQNNDIGTPLHLHLDGLLNFL